VAYTNIYLSGLELAISTAHTQWSSIFLRISVLGVSWASWGTRFQVGMTGADQRRYLRPDE